MAGLGAVAAMLFVLGERPAVVPSSHPGADLGLLGGAVTRPSARLVRHRDAAVRSRGADSVAWLQAHRWSFPSELPDGWAVSAVRWSGDDSSVLEVDVRRPRGLGRRDRAAGPPRRPTRSTGAPTSQVGGREVYVLSYEPWHVVWQADSTVVQVVAARVERLGRALVGAFPGGAFDDGVPAQITRGWDTVTGALERP